MLDKKGEHIYIMLDNRADCDAIQRLHSGDFVSTKPNIILLFIRISDVIRQKMTFARLTNEVNECKINVNAIWQI